MLHSEPLPPQSVRRLAVVISGSFRRGLATLRSDREALLGSNCEVLSPVDVDFVREEQGFVFAEQEQGMSPDEIEAAHVAAIRAADFLWLHAPEGYLGP